MLAGIEIANAHLVAREKLTWFLEQVALTDNVDGLCKRIRAERVNLTRVKARYLCMRDEAEVPLSSLPAAITVEPGDLRIRCGTVEELVAHMVAISQAMQDDPLAFQARFELVRAEGWSAEAEDARYIKAEIERMKASSTPAD